MTFTTPEPSANNAAEPNATSLGAGWRSAVSGLKRQGALGASKRFAAVVEDITTSVNDLNNYDAAIRKHTFSATIGTARLARDELAPAPCPVHSYNTALSTLRKKHAAFNHAERVLGGPIASCSVHSYSGASFTPKSTTSTFGRASTGRGEPPKTACSVAYYSAERMPTARPTRPVGTFGTAPARGSVTMSRTGLVLAPSKPTTLPPIGSGPSRTAATARAATFASKLRKAVSSSEVLVVEHKEEEEEDVLATGEEGMDVEDTTPATPPADGLGLLLESESEPRSLTPVAATPAKLDKGDDILSPVKRKLSMDALAAPAFGDIRA